MPQVDGIEAARRILATRPLPIVMLTAYAQTDLVERAADAGAFGYLVKPFREADLLPAMQTARARFEELQAVRHRGRVAAGGARGPQGHRARRRASSWRATT